MMKTVIELYERQGLHAKKAASTNGGELAGPCPGCGGVDRFRIWPVENNGDGAWWCRQCGKAGDSIQFLRDFCNMSFKQACEELDRPLSEIDRYARPKYNPAAAGPPAFEPKPGGHPDEVDATKWREKASAFVDECHQRLVHDEKILQWLDGRGIDLEAVRRHRLGWHAGENGHPARWRPADSWGLPEKISEKTGRPMKLWLPRGVVIPVFDAPMGELLRLRIRRPKADLPENSKNKYIWVRGGATGSMLLGRERQGFVIVEAELDAIACFAAAGDVCGAIALGSSSTKPDAATDALLKKSLCILLALDFDQAGAKEFVWWKQTYKQTERWPVPKGKDPGDAVGEGVDLRQWILSGLPPVFRVGPLPSEKVKKRGGNDDIDPAAQADGGTATPEANAAVDGSVQRLAEILQANPQVRIVCDRRRCKIEWREGWENDAVLKRLSELVYFDPECFSYIHKHPAGIIDGRNIV